MKENCETQYRLVIALNGENQIKQNGPDKILYKNRIRKNPNIENLKRQINCDFHLCFLEIAKKKFS